MSESEFVLALDMGMSRVGAAGSRLATSGEIDADSHVLGHGSGPFTAVCCVTEQGDLLFGEEAESEGESHPERLIRGFIRDLGDGVPLVVNRRSILPEEVCARFVLWAVEQATAEEGVRPTAIVLTHPSSWTGHRVSVLRDTLRRSGIDDVEFTSSAEAVAHHHDEAIGIGSGETVAVYDLGGSAFEATVLQKRADGSFTVRGTPVRLADHGGQLFDDAVVAHALTASGALSTNTGAGDAARPSTAGLRRAAVAAKHTLSSDGEATLTLDADGDGGTTVRITRSEFEAAIEATLDRTIEAFERALTSAHRSPGQIDRIILAGGSTSIPLVAQRLSDRFDRPLTASPEGAAALGAAGWAAHERLAAAAQGAAPVPQPEPATSTDRRPVSSRLLAAFRPALVGTTARTAAGVTIVAATVVIATGVAVTAFGAGLGTPSAEQAAIADGAGRITAGSQSGDLDALLDLPLPAPESEVQNPPADTPSQPPLLDPDSGDETDRPTSRRAVRQPLGGTDTVSTTPRTMTPTTTVRTPSTTPPAVTPVPPGSGPSGPTPSDPVPADPPPVETPVDDPPPAETPVDDPPPADPPPADPPVEDPPPADPPAGDIPAGDDAAHLVPVAARTADAPSSDL